MKKQAQYQEVPVPMAELETKFSELFEQLDDAVSGITVFLKELKPYIDELDAYKSTQLGELRVNEDKYWDAYDTYNESVAGDTNNKAKERLEEMHEMFEKLIERASYDI